MKEEWEEKALGEICHLDKKKHDGRNLPYVGMEDISSGTGLFLGSELHNEVKSSTFGFTQDHILYGRLRPYLNKVLLPSFTGHCSTEIFPLLPSNEVIQKFLFYWLTADPQIAKINTTCTGARMPRANFKEVLTFPVPVPPLAEQEEIVEILDKAFAAIDQAKTNIEQNIANAKELFQSKLNQIFSQKGEGWVEKSLSETLESQPRNGWSPPAANHSDSGTPVLTLSSVTGFEFRKDKIKHTSIETDSGRHYWVANGELLITRSNTPELVGHVAIAEGIERPTIYPDLIMRMVPNATMADTKFLYYQLRAPLLREIITSRASGANPTMKKINKSAVQTLPIFVPPLPQQKNIVQQLDTLSAKTRALESHYQTKLASLEELKKSLLQKAFAGKLT